MKILTIICLLFLRPAMSSAQSSGIEVLNPTLVETANDERIYHFYQGQTVVVSLNEELRNQKRSVYVFLLGNTYHFNSKGLAFIGVDLFMEPGEYPICLDDKCDDRKNHLRIKVMKADFSKTRISRTTQPPQPRTGKQAGIIAEVFNDDNRMTEDLTRGVAYLNPLSNMVPEDPFGFIYENNPYRPHGGVDLLTRVGTPVRSINNGKVALVAKRFRNEGNMIIINYGNGIFGIYMHLSKFGTVNVTKKPKGKTSVIKKELKAGDLVEKGQIIGLSGRTGAGVDVPHLHFAVKIQRNIVPGHYYYVDPLKFIETANQYLN